MLVFYLLSPYETRIGHSLSITFNQMGMEVLEGLRVTQSQQRPLSRKVNKRINSHSVIYRRSQLARCSSGSLTLIAYSLPTVILSLRKVGMSLNQSGCPFRPPKLSPSDRKQAAEAQTGPRALNSRHWA